MNYIFPAIVKALLLRLVDVAETLVLISLKRGHDRPFLEYQPYFELSKVLKYSFSLFFLLICSNLYDIALVIGHILVTVESAKFVQIK